MRALLLAAVLTAAVAAAPAAVAQCRVTPEMAAHGDANSWLFVQNAATLSNLTGTTVEFDCGTERLHGDEVAGYKAGLTTRAAQARFGTDAPLLGVLFRSMILDGGAEIEIAGRAGARWEADFLLVVGDAAINKARTRAEALAALRGFRPFIEVPVLPAVEGRAPVAADLAEVNVGAWRGVAGPELPLPANAMEALAAMRVVALDEAGVVLAEGKGSDALGHPLDVVLWVRDQVLANGGRLRPGDVISVGAFTPLTPPKPGQRITVRYEGLPGSPAVMVRFR